MDEARWRQKMEGDDISPGVYFSDVGKLRNLHSLSLQERERERELYTPLLTVYSLEMAAKRFFP